MQISLTINGQPHHLETDPRTLLLDTLREELGLGGTKYGCGEGECGACTVILNGRAVNACLTTAGQAHGAEIFTIEGLTEDRIGSRVLTAFAEAGAVQCGFCTPGFVVSARALLAANPTPNIEAIRHGLSGNLCRCTGYTKIIQAVAQAAVGAAEIATVRGNRHSPQPISSANGHFARPASLEDALRLLTQPGWRVVAGGTDVLVQYEHRVKSLHLLDLSALSELRQIYEDANVVHIGALATYTDLIHSAVVQRHAPALVQAAREVGGGQIQNMGTLGGNLVNASPAADGVPPLYVLEALVVLRSQRGERTVAVQDFASGPGKTVILPDELLTEIIVPKISYDGREITFFEKVGPRQAQTIAKASVAFRGWLAPNGRLTQVRVALGAVAPTVMLVAHTAQALMSGPFTAETLLQAGDVAQAECRPIDDIRSTAVYRRKLVRGLLIRNLWPYLA
jgi:carbon-monoxide dehydrogenase small subunit/xanthine dehydrogenase small subunit